REAQMRRLLDLADRHTVLPTVVSNINRLAERGQVLWSGDDKARALWASVPDMILARTGVCLALRQQAREILQAFGQAGVPVLVLKGSDFADRLYPHPGLRTFTDVDLLIPQSALAAGREVMARLGYQPIVVAMKYELGYSEEVYRRPQRAAGNVEVHTDLVNSPSLRRGLSVTFEDLQLTPADPLPHPSPAATILIAAVHGAASHSFDRLQLLVDLTQAVRQAAWGLDEAWLQAAIARTGAASALAMGLRLAYRLLGEIRCREFSQRLGLPPPGWLCRLAMSRGVILRGHAWRDSFRRQLFRRVLKSR
ncbi:MAG: nucleotidyltransferase family protein, partial [Phycisphaerae bacterium]|nr:nucleotidyltransferase family protein [Phycisphaerae bacterium]